MIALPCNLLVLLFENVVSIFGLGYFPAFLTNQLTKRRQIISANDVEYFLSKRRVPFLGQSVAVMLSF